jgi:hypothetical protein
MTTSLLRVSDFVTFQRVLITLKSGMCSALCDACMNRPYGDAVSLITITRRKYTEETYWRKLMLKQLLPFANKIQNSFCECEFIVMSNFRCLLSGSKLCVQGC